MISLRTNVDSMIAQNNLSTNETFQSNTIQQLTSGYRINKSGDDAAGLAIANSYRDNVAELTQGVSNANNGVSQLQIIDGGLSNISTILDRMKTLATQSASQTFTGNRAVLNQEYSGLINEINRQAANINLNQGGTFNNSLSVYIGGANNSANANVLIDLSGKSNAVDATSLGLSNTSIDGGGANFSGNALNLTAADAAGQKFVKGTGNQTFNFYVAGQSQASPVAVTLTGTSTGYTLSQALSSINAQLAANTKTAGITAGVDANGQLQFTGSTAFTVKDAGASAGTLTNTLTDYSAFKAASGYVSGSEGLGANGSNYSYDAGTYGTGLSGSDTDTLNFTTGSGSSVSVQLTASTGDTLAHAIAAINTATSSYGIYAMADARGTGIEFQSSTGFSVNDTQTTAQNGVFNTDNTATAGVNYSSNVPPSASNGTSAIAAVNAAIQNLGLVQGSVGAGENKLQYAINLAQSQITNFSSAESQIRDANVAAEAANLTKAQVLQQTSIAAMAQANSEPQSVLKLLQ